METRTYWNLGQDGKVELLVVSMPIVPFSQLLRTSQLRAAHLNGKFFAWLLVIGSTLWTIFKIHLLIFYYCCWLAKAGIFAKLCIKVLKSILHSAQPGSQEF
jgi:hypothetical protein